jgi:hypothetical protein
MQDLELHQLREPLTDADTCTNCIFEEPWWLDAVAPGRWFDATVRRDGRIIARLPYLLSKGRRSGFVYSTQPPLTQTLGPCLRTSANKESTRLAEEKELLAALIHQLPSCDLFSQTCSPNVMNGLPFYWNHFSLEAYYTYRLEASVDTERLWEGLTKECRNTVRKARKTVVVRDGLDVARFYEIVAKTWERQRLVPPFAKETLLRLDECCAGRKVRSILHAEDAQGNIHAAAYLVWDRRTAYYLLGGSDPGLRASGANSLLLWEAIRFASTVSEVFDFEGSMNERIEPVFRSFGARQQVLLHISRMSRRMRAVSAVRTLFEVATGKGMA